MDKIMHVSGHAVDRIIGVSERITGVALADLVDRVNVKIIRERGDVSGKDIAGRTGADRAAMDEDEWRPVSGLPVAGPNSSDVDIPYHVEAGLQLSRLKLPQTDTATGPGGCQTDGRRLVRPSVVPGA